MKKHLLFAVMVSLLSFQSSAQLRHYIGINENIYRNMFLGEQEPLRFGYFSKSNKGEAPEFTYRIRYKGHAIEAYYTNVRNVYQSMSNEMKAGHFTLICYAMFGLNYHYNFYESKHINVSGFTGLNRMHFTVVEKLISAFPGEYMFGKTGFPKSAYGLQLGTNITVPVWRGLYVNSNIRYTNVPWAKNPIYQNNLLLNVGLGYQFGRGG